MSQNVLNESVIYYGSKRRAEMQEQSAANGPMSDAGPASDEDELLSLDEAVQFLTTSRPTFYRLLGQGDLKGFKVGRQWRFRRSELVAYLARPPPAGAPAPAEG